MSHLDVDHTVYSCFSMSQLVLWTSASHSQSVQDFLQWKRMMTTYLKLKGQSFHHLECELILNQVKFSQEDAHYLSEATSLQSQSLLWFEHRKGRITASQFGAVCRTSIQSPSRSLLDRILQRTPMVKAAV